ncbi:hypothetical protein E2C01_049446 [Portunus trituberculatus]|uniref:Uncharacterized protein n=1 Tax=Portunus trituberculatus TaxID=210409 RepID=A0A5B7GD42_PORTR|nr:hypothetical protein [Portunus trituberculatus]
MYPLTPKGGPERHSVYRRHPRRIENNEAFPRPLCAGRATFLLSGMVSGHNGRHAAQSGALKPTAPPRPVHTTHNDEGPPQPHLSLPPSLPSPLHPRPAQEGK